VSNYVPHHTKKKRILEKRESQLTDALKLNLLLEEIREIDKEHDYWKSLRDEEIIEIYKHKFS
jgi:hypothetical protein